MKVTGILSICIYIYIYVFSLKIDEKKKIIIPIALIKSKYLSLNNINFQ